MSVYDDIDPEDIAYVKQVWDDTITTWGKPCKLVYSGKETICPNCIVNTQTGQSTNRYKPGGPVPFPRGEICPVCNGTGKITGTDNYDIATFMIDWEPKNWQIVLATTNNTPRIPGAVAATQGFVTDLPKVIRADYVILDIESNYTSNRYTLAKEPISIYNFIRNRYFMAYWVRA